MKPLMWEPGAHAYPLEPGHGWRARPGHRILIVDNGAVRFDFPKEWTLQARRR